VFWQKTGGGPVKKKPRASPGGGPCFPGNFSGQGVWGGGFSRAGARHQNKKKTDIHGALLGGGRGGVPLGG